jgi:hypothetical protein
MPQFLVAHAAQSSEHTSSRLLMLGLRLAAAELLPAGPAPGPLLVPALVPAPLLLPTVLARLLVPAEPDLAPPLLRATTGELKDLIPEV